MWRLLTRNGSLARYKCHLNRKWRWGGLFLPGHARHICGPRGTSRRTQPRLPSRPLPGLTLSPCPCAQSRSTVHPEHNGPRRRYPPQLCVSLLHFEPPKSAVLPIHVGWVTRYPRHIIPVVIDCQHDRLRSRA